MAQWEYQNMTYPLPQLPSCLSMTRAAPLVPSLAVLLSSQGFFNRDHICCRNSSEGHVNPPWHSWLSRQTDRQATGLTPLLDGLRGNKIYNWPNLPSVSRGTVWQIQGKLTLRVSYLNPKHPKLWATAPLFHTLLFCYEATWIWICWCCLLNLKKINK